MQLLQLSCSTSSKKYKCYSCHSQQCKCGDNQNMLTQEFLDYIAILSVALSVVNYRENLDQSTNDDLMRVIDEKTTTLLNGLKKDLQKQNEMLEILLERTKNDD